MFTITAKYVKTSGKALSVASRETDGYTTLPSTASDILKTVYAAVTLEKLGEKEANVLIEWIKGINFDNPCVLSKIEDDNSITSFVLPKIDSNWVKDMTERAKQINALEEQIKTLKTPIVEWQKGLSIRKTQGRKKSDKPEVQSVPVNPMDLL